MCSSDSTGRPEITWSRRLFMRRGLAFASLAATTPLFLERSARGILGPESLAMGSQPGVPEDHVLVVVQLSGGNDGLNTVVPFGDPVYHRLRPRLGLAEPGRGNDAALLLDENLGLGLHPSLTGLKDLVDGGLASVIQGVGYPNPNRSHFTSMDIWHSADPEARGTGWLGRYFDNQCSGRPDALAAVSLGERAPLAMIGDSTQPVNFERPERFAWTGGEVAEALERPYAELSRTGGLDGGSSHPHLDFLTRTSLDAQVASDELARAAAGQPLVSWPRGPLASQLRTISAMLRAGLGTRVFYVSLGGFDTHAGQPARHAQLLRQVGDAIKAFQDELAAQGDAGRVMTMVFSEFGRRVAQNASQGTDHGTAAPMFLIGEMVRPGVLGQHPSLTDLDAGDLKYTVDFRNVYAGILKGWMGCDPRAILRGDWEPARILAGA
jgi:uncharacterized protein (DUF1501 family)